MKPLILPQLSLNGTARQQLINQQCNVMEALDQLQRAMAEAYPNGRDYQHHPKQYKEARAAWEERQQLIHDMHREIETHAVAIQEI
jgi:DNA repair ATPase RecN